MILLLIGFCQSSLLNFIPETKTPPSLRSGALMDYFEPHSTLIIFGGVEGIKYLNDIWEFSLEYLTWSEILILSSAKPCNFNTAPRESAGGATVSPERKFYIFGGITNLGPENDLWEFDFDSLIWNKIDTVGTPQRTNYFGFTKYMEGGIFYLLVQGGIQIDLETNNMYR